MSIRSIRIIDSKYVRHANPAPQQESTTTHEPAAGETPIASARIMRGACTRAASSCHHRYDVRRRTTYVCASSLRILHDGTTHTTTAHVVTGRYDYYAASYILLINTKRRNNATNAGRRYRIRISHNNTTYIVTLLLLIA